MSTREVHIDSDYRERGLRVGGSAGSKPLLPPTCISIAASSGEGNTAHLMVTQLSHRLSKHVVLPLGLHYRKLAASGVSDWHC